MHRHLRLLPIAVTVTMILVISHPGFSATAQDMARAGTPTMGGCIPLSPRPSTPLPAATATAESSPVPTPPPVGSPADDATIDRVIAAEYNLANCLNAGNWSGAATLFTEHYRASERGSGTTSLDDFAAHLEAEISAPIELIAVENVEVLADGRVRDELIWYFGDVQLHERDYWVAENGSLRLDWIETLAIDGTPTA
jgi:hypothetical protein